MKWNEIEISNVTAISDAAFKKKKKWVEFDVLGRLFSFSEIQ